MKRLGAIVLITAASMAGADAGRVIVLDSELQRLVPADAVIEKVADGFKFTEGPLWSPKGFLLFSDIYGDRIYRWTPDRGVDVFRDSAGFPNGLTYDRKRRLLICDQKDRRLVRLKRDGTTEVLADKWQGKRLNCPNDVVCRRDGTLYFTDPYWKFPPGSTQELDFQGVYRIAPDGKISLEAKDFGLPNGIALSPDEKTLYIGDTRRRKLYAFDIAPNGSLGSSLLFADLESKEKGAVDGMKIDEHGNIYTTGPGGIWVISKQAKHLGTIVAPEIPANCAWGGSDYQTLFLAAPTSMYRVRTLVRGKATYDLKRP